MKWLEVFIEWIDNLYFDGYAEQLRTYEPEVFKYEFDRFCEIHTV